MGPCLWMEHERVHEREQRKADPQAVAHVYDCTAAFFGHVFGVVSCIINKEGQIIVRLSFCSAKCQSKKCFKINEKKLYYLG